MSTLSEPTSLPAYVTDQFVDRVDEVQQVVNFALKRQEGKTKDAAMFIKCERGSGKTWFSFHLKRTGFDDLPGIFPYLICFATPRKIESSDSQTEFYWQKNKHRTTTLTEIGSWFLNALGVNEINERSIEEIQIRILREIKKMPSNYLLVIILDSIYDVDEMLMEELEKVFLTPLLESQKAIFVFTGRDRDRKFNKSELRNNANSFKLSNFSEELVRELVVKIKERFKIDKDAYSERDIINISQGYPLVVFLLTQGNDLEKVVKEVLPEEITSLGRRALEALCSLGDFSEDEIKMIIKAHKGIVQQGWSTEGIRVNVLQPLIDNGLLISKGGEYYLDANVRHVMREYLFRCKPDVWLNLNSAAYEYYQKQVEEHPGDFQEYYRKLAIKHKEECQRV